MKKISMLILTAGLLFLLIGCGNNSTVSHNDYQKTDEDYQQNNDLESSEDIFYEKLYNEYDEVGNIVDGIVWVKKEEYSGVKCGYLKTTGEWLIPLTADIKIPHDFYKGFAIVEFEEDPMNNNWSGIYDLEGNLVATFQRHAISEWNVLSNGNIYFTQISMHKDSSDVVDGCMFCANNRSFVPMPIPAKNTIQLIDYSEGLLSVWCDYYKTPGTKYFDELGNCVIDVDASSEYYKTVVYAGAFNGGKAEIQFYGLDSNLYSVNIDKSGNWVGEPKRISEDEMKDY